ncbi:MAG TPA: CinA family nicotinamide mononucleotide deamidase-related protein [Chloroflexia bacterium]|nr:CinA family nicotinamide mononucleotide deamidase-related protein [Chloroflexia bacterium]
MVEPGTTTGAGAVRAEIISVGTELLLGTIVDTNGAYLAQRLAALGIDCYYISAVGDNLGRLTKTLSRAFRRSDIVICTGGLGPTGDDLTREAVAAALGEEPFVVPELEAGLQAFFERRGVEMPLRNLKQATLIPSARAISNPVGTAPGWWVEANVEGAPRTGIFMPGVPFEMKRMWEQEVEPALRHRSGMVLVSRTLKVLGAGESAVEERVADLTTGSNPTLAPYAKSDGIHLRMTAKSGSEEGALSMISALESKVRERLGDLIYGTDDDTPQGVVDGLAREIGLAYCALEVGFGGDGVLLPTFENQPGFRGGLQATTLVEARTALGAGAHADTAEIARELATRTGANLVLAVSADISAVDGDATIVRADVTSEVYSANGLKLVAQRQSWQVPRGEVARVARLLALNLLRRKLIAIKREGVERIAE